MPINYHTTVPIFLLIVFGYIGLNFLLGAKKAYFEPWYSPPDDPEEKHLSSGELKPGASPWKVGEGPSSDQTANK